MSIVPIDTVAGSPTLRSLRGMLEAVGDSMLLLDGDLRIIYANAEARETYLLGNAQRPQFVRFVAASYPEADLAELESSLTALLTEPTSECSVIRLHSGIKEVQIRLSGIESESEQETVISVIMTEPHAEAHLKHLEFVLDASTDGIFIFNRANKIVYFNSACENMTGWKRGAAFETYECANVLRCHNEAGESMSSEALCPAKVFFHRDSVPVPHEMLITTRGGKERWVETNYSPIKNATGEVEFVVGIIRDIDERKRLESQLVQSKNLASLGQLISGIAHEIKNPLGIIMSSVEVLINEDRPTGQRREAAVFLKDEVRRLDDRVKDFLAFAKPKPMMLEEVNVNSLLTKVVLSYKTLSSGRFRTKTDFAKKVPPVLGDPDLLHQVFLNLIINADQAMRFGGELQITTAGLDDEVRIQFIDQGQGIPAENLQKIFDPFYTTKKEGTGLGLSIVHQILTSHKGQYTVRNNDGQPGITFEILFPANRKPRL